MDSVQDVLAIPKSSEMYESLNLNNFRLYGIALAVAVICVIRGLHNFVVNFMTARLHNKERIKVIET